MGQGLGGDGPGGKFGVGMGASAAPALRGVRHLHSL